MIELKSYPARNGDAFLLKATEKPFIMLVDGGYAETFHQHVRPDLVDLAARGHGLDLVVATHVDADHISGLLSFFSLNGRADAPAIIPVHQVLHNSLRSLVAPTQRQSELRPDDLSLLREIRLRGFPLPVSVSDLEQEISARQGNSLAQLLRNGGYRWNKDNGVPSVGGDGLPDLSFPQVKIKFLGPNAERLEGLRKWWTSEMRRFGYVGSLEDLDDIFEFLCAHEVVVPGEQMLASSDSDLVETHVPDNSITNGSSISMLVQIQDHRLLFLADAWASDMVAALRESGPMIFDAIKVAHHGSSRNTSPELLALVDAPHFFVSTNGESHNHPDFAVLKAIVDRPASFRRTLHFNYSTPASLRLRAYRAQTGAAFDVEDGGPRWVSIGETMHHD